MTTARSTGTEIVLGLVGAIGADLRLVAEHLEAGLARAGFSSSPIRVIELIHDLERWTNLPSEPERRRLETHVESGDEFCQTSMRGDALGALAVARIKKLRSDLGLDPFRASTRHAYIVKSLNDRMKSSCSAACMAEAFLLIAASAPEGSRFEEEETPAQYGRDLLGTYAQADVFLETAERDTVEEEVERLLEILLKHPFRTPRIDEYGMALARIAALRSASLSWQVGAAILDPRGALRVLGTNEVPCFGGGAYWEGDVGDSRDFHLQRDVTADYCERDLADLLRRLAAVGWLQPSKRRAVEEDLSSAVREAVSHPQVADARIMKSIEHGRAIHAEAAAISAAAAAGISIDGCTLYTTAFPCHQCARPIVASGMTRVVYLHPYPRSLVKDFFSDSIAVEGTPQEESPGNPSSGFRRRSTRSSFVR